MNEVSQNKWLGKALVQTDLEPVWLQNHIEQLRSRSDVLDTHRGSFWLIGKGALVITCAIDEMSLEDAKEEGEVIIGAVLIQMDLAGRIRQWDLQISPLEDPSFVDEIAGKILPFRRNE